MPNTPKLVCLLCILLFTINNISAQTQKIAEVDSTILAYYNKMQANIRNPEVLLMADTLFDMARIDGDARMQAVAIASKVDHYYFTKHEHQKDSLEAWVKRVKQFARKTNQPKYYYFVWGSRLINFYLHRNEHNIALLETEKMLKEAEAEGYREGIAQCYSNLANIYSVKSMGKLQLEYSIKEVELVEKYNLESYNISSKYSAIAQMLLNKNNFEKAEEYIKKAEKDVLRPHHEFKLKIAKADYFLKKKDYPKARKLLDECEKMTEDEETIVQQVQNFYKLDLEYYVQIGMYEKALEAVDRLEDEVKKRGDSVLLTNCRLNKANIYWEMGRKSEAADLYKPVIKQMVEDKNKAEEVTSAEFATLLDLQRLNTEKKELEEEAKERQLSYTRTVVIMLTVLLLIVFFFLLHQRKLNKKLRKSHNELNEKSKILLKAEEELRHAKDAAEESSRLKTVFIQNMSHEIRTPLNSIVGFSTLLSEMFADESEEVKQYADTIEKNSQLLLKMINDILDISGLDQDDREVEYAPVNINQCCKRAIEETKPVMAEGVTLKFTPIAGDATIKSNEVLLMHILLNLLNNAAKFTHQGSIELVCQLDKEKHELHLSVTDTGIGIPLDKYEYVFERFTKLDEFSQGTGLGLPISRLSARELGGDLSIDEHYTTGTRFVLNLPIKY